MIIHMRFPDGLRKALTFSYDDAVEQDMRLVDIFDKHGLKGTFNINTGSFSPEGTVHPEGQIHRRMTEKQTYDLLANSPHEVAVHTLTHPYLEKMPAASAAYEVLGDKMNIEKLFGRITRGMAYPFGTYSQEVIDILKSCGIVYSRVCSTTSKFNLPDNWYKWQATCHHRNPDLMTLAKKFVEEKPPRAPWLFYVWGHSYEFEQADNWNIMEEFADYVAFKKDIWYATNIEIYEYVEAYNSMRLSADCKIMHNPTCRELFFEVGGKARSIKPGETITL